MQTGYAMTAAATTTITATAAAITASEATDMEQPEASSTQQQPMTSTTEGTTKAIWTTTTDSHLGHNAEGLGQKLTISSGRSSPPNRGTNKWLSHRISSHHCCHQQRYTNTITQPT
jgi:hypothetical protein